MNNDEFFTISMFIAEYFMKPTYTVFYLAILPAVPFTQWACFSIDRFRCCRKQTVLQNNNALAKDCHRQPVLKVIKHP